VEFKRQKFATEIFKEEIMSFLDKRKKWMTSHFWFSHLQTLSILHNICVWSWTLKADNHQVQKPILFEKCWEGPSSCIVMYQSTKGWSV